MNNNRRRHFRPRSQKNSFRRRSSSSNPNNQPSFNNNGNKNFSRNGFSNNINGVEKAIHKFQQLAKDSQSAGDPVMAENYLQHADHYLRRFNELTEKNKENSINRIENSEDTASHNEVQAKSVVWSEN